MNPSYFNGYKGITPLIITEEDNAPNKDNLDAKAIYDKRMLQATNNKPLCRDNDLCGDENTNDETPEEIVRDNVAISINSRSSKVTFETIRKNLASLNYETNYKSSKYITKIYYLSTEKQIILTTDMQTKGLIISKLTGDTGFEKTLVKTEIIKDKKITVKYHEEG